MWTYTVSCQNALDGLPRLFEHYILFFPYFLATVVKYFFIRGCICFVLFIMWLLLGVVSFLTQTIICSYSHLSRPSCTTFGFVDSQPFLCLQGSHSRGVQESSPFCSIKGTTWRLSTARGCDGSIVFSIVTNIFLLTWWTHESLHLM